MSSFDFRSDTPHKELHGIDSSDAFELAPTTNGCSGTLGVFRSLNDGGAEGAGLTPVNADLSRGKYFSLILIERLSESILFQARKCVLVSQSWNAPARGYLTGSLSFKSTDFTNEVSRLG